MSKLLYIKQLELLLLSCRRTLDENNITIPEQTLEFIDAVTYANDHLDAVDLLDTIEIIKEEIEKQLPYYLEEDYNA